MGQTAVIKNLLQSAKVVYYKVRQVLQSVRKNSMAKITQNRRIALFSLWSFNQGEVGKKKKKNGFYDSQNNLFEKDG